MRILSAVCTYPPYAGGIGNVAARQAHMLRDAGHTVDVLTPAHGDAPGARVQDGVTVHRMPTLVRHGNSALVRGVGALVSGTDLACIHYPFYGGAEPMAAACRRHGVPYVVFFHMDVHREGIAGMVLRVHRRTLQPWIMRGARAVLASSLDYVESSTLAGLDLPRLVESPYAAPSTFSPGQPDLAALQAMGLDPQALTFLFVGAMDSDHQFKGVPELLRAFAAISRSDQGIQLVLAGTGDQRAEFITMAEGLGLERVHFPGRVSDEDLVSLYRFAYCTVLPSTTSDEAFGVVLAEGMACGAPGIASDLPGVRALVRNGDTGLLAAPGDVSDLAGKMRWLITHPADRDRMAGEALAERQARRLPQHEESCFLGALGLPPSSR